MTTVDELLEHHGIKGMKWGVRKEEDSGGRGRVREKIHSIRENKAKRHEEIAKTFQSQIDQINAAPESRNPFVRASRKQQVEDLSKFRDQNAKDAKAVRSGHLTKGEKDALIGVGVAGALLAAYGAYKLTDAGTINQLRTKAVPFARDHGLARKMSPDEIMKEVVGDINPGYGAPGSKMNCRRCTLAYEMRRRGLDVQATRSIQGTGQTVAGILNATDPESDLATGPIGISRELVKEARRGGGGPLTTAIKTAGGIGTDQIGEPSAFAFMTGKEKTSEIFQAIGLQPDGARGELGVIWGMGGGHSMAWEVIDGKAHIFDTQSGVHYSQAEFAEKLGDSVANAALTRLDNVQLNFGYLRKWVKNVE